MCEKRKALAIKRCTLRMCSEYGLLTMLTVCPTDRTTSQLLSTVGKRAAELDIFRRGLALNALLVRLCHQKRATFLQEIFS